MNGASLNRSVTGTAKHGCIHVTLNNIHSRTRVHNRHHACVNSVPNGLVRGVTGINIGGPLFLLSRVSGVSSSVQNSPTSTLLRILSPRRGMTFDSRCLRISCSLDSIVFITASGSVGVPTPLLSHVRIVHLSNCARSRGLGVTGHRLLPGRVRHGTLGGNRLAISSDTVVNVVHCCAHRTNIHNLRHRVSGLYHGTIGRLLLSGSLGRVRVGNSGLRSCLNIRHFSCNHTSGRGHINRMANLT